MNQIFSFKRNIPKCLNHPLRPSTTMNNLQGDDYLYCAECNYENSKELSNLKKAVVFNEDYGSGYSVRPGKRQKTQQRSKKTLVKRLRDEWEK